MGGLQRFDLLMGCGYSILRGSQFDKVGRGVIGHGLYGIGQLMTGLFPNRICSFDPAGSDAEVVDQLADTH